MSDGTTTAQTCSTVKRPKNKKWYWARRAVQALIFVLFLYLVVRTQQAITPFFHDLFFDLDPLAAISAMTASRSLISGMLWSIATLILAIAFGRVWCSWICPLGTVLDWTPSRNPSRKRPDIHPYWRSVKYFLLFTILFASLFGSLTLMFLDPITLLVRTMAAVVLPGLSASIIGAETILYNMSPLQPAVGWLDSLLRGTLIIDQPFFFPNLVLAAVFAAVLGLNAVRPRFWCRYLCPLGGLLGLVSNAALVRHNCDQETCTSCQRCALTCPMGAIDPKQNFAANSAECTTCLDCVETCPADAISFRTQPVSAVKPQFEPSRRQFLAALGLAVIGTALIKVMPVFGKNPSGLIRPPGTDDEKLMSACIRCGECIKVCPTGAIQPSMSGTNPDGTWTPALMTRLGYCDYMCIACGTVCPTGAIPLLSLEQKQKAVIGIAVIDRKRCIPWAKGTDCIVCEEVCPIPDKAVRLDMETVTNEQGQRVTVRAPRVKTEMCTGCGICEKQCPVDGESAIRIFTEATAVID